LAFSFFSPTVHDAETSAVHSEQRTGIKCPKRSIFSNFSFTHFQHCSHAQRCSSLAALSPCHLCWSCSLSSLSAPLFHLSLSLSRSA